MDILSLTILFNTSIPDEFGQEQTASHPLEHKLQTAVNFPVGAGNEIKVLSNSTCPSPL